MSNSIKEVEIYSKKGSATFIIKDIKNKKRKGKIRGNFTDHDISEIVTVISANNVDFFEKNLKFVFHTYQQSIADKIYDIFTSVSKETVFGTEESPLETLKKGAYVVKNAHSWPGTYTKWK